MTSAGIVGLTLAFAVLFLGGPTARADGSGPPSAFTTTMRHAPTTPMPAASSLNPQPLPPAPPGDPAQKSGIIIIGGKNKSTKAPSLPRTTIRERALGTQK